MLEYKFGGKASYTFTTPGNYKVKLELRYPGVYAPTISIINVTVLGDLDIDITGPGIYTGGSAMQLLGTDSYYTYTATPNFEYNGIFTWSVSPAPSSSYYIYPHQFVVKFPTNGTYTITVSSGNPAVVTQETVRVWRQPAVIIK
jgi:hypothetical protein